MTQVYSDPARESDPYALPDVEVFEVDEHTPEHFFDAVGTDPIATDLVGWYWWSCFPGCLPDGEPNGPFATEAEAIANAQEGASEDSHEDGWPADADMEIKHEEER